MRVTFLNSIGLEAVAEAPSEITAEAAIVKIPNTNIGKARRSIMLFCVIILHLGSVVFLTLLNSGDI